MAAAIMLIAVYILLLASTHVAVTVIDDAHHAEVTELRADVIRLTTLLTAHDVRLKSLEKHNRQLRADNVNLQSDNQELSDLVRQLKADDRDLRDKSQELEEGMKQLTLGYQEMLTDNRHLRYSLTLLNEKLLNAKLDHVIRDVSARSDDTSPLEAVVAGLNQQVTAVSGEVQVLRSVDQQHSQAIQQAATSTYTRWGHSACPPDNNLVYSGVVGGSWWQHSGAASNYLCLSLSPAVSSRAKPLYYAYLFGGEYETWDDGFHHNKDPVCAVCRSPRPNTIMVPGTNVCMTGWTPEYSGYLMAGEYDHVASTEYICVDASQESRTASDDNQNGVLLYYTVAMCGSLPCGPYVNNTVVTCALCSQ